ncbi:hypothetical protein [Alkaliphilus transvaalensis]|uniref:hypothetical protein n=1 Tax=Alkaliphilus transvaalensis TaxID=114628 RepID=UPI00047C446E|nr:hypothetical protein [Alkaliphilus transvaalensis]
MWLEIFKRYISVFLLGIVIKLLDDEVDQDQELRGMPDNQVLRELQLYKLPYSLLFLSIAMILDPHYSFALFSGAYITGMFHITNQRLPLKLKSYQEIILITLLNILLLPIDVFFHGMFLIFIIQLLDDLLDLDYDITYGYFNYVHSFGKVEVGILILIFIIASFMLSWVNTLIILPLGILINYLYSWL